MTQQTALHSDARQQLMRATARRDLLWRRCQSWNEDNRIDGLVAYCTALCSGDATAGGALAKAAIWS